MDDPCPIVHRLLSGEISGQGIETMAGILRVSRQRGLLDRYRRWDIVLDGTVVGRSGTGSVVTCKSGRVGTRSGSGTDGCRARCGVCHPSLRHHRLCVPSSSPSDDLASIRSRIALPTRSLHRLGTHRRSRVGRSPRLNDLGVSSALTRPASLIGARGADTATCRHDRSNTGIDVTLEAQDRERGRRRVGSHGHAHLGVQVIGQRCQAPG